MSRGGIAFAITIALVVGFFWNHAKSKDDRQYNNQRATAMVQHTSASDQYGLLASDYDRNGWTQVHGKWVSNPRAGAVVKYSSRETISTSSQRVSSSVPQKNSIGRSYRNFSSIEETYPILRRVARDLEYSDIPALRKSFEDYAHLRANHFYEIGGRKFYNQQAYFEYRIQKGRKWGSRNDQNGDGVINCQDYAELFYKYASEAGYHVKYISNTKLNHAFNGVNVNGKWITIEPQAAEGGLDRSPLMSVRFSNYNSSYDVIKKQL